MKKKLVTLALAATMTVGSVFSAMAEDVDCTGWWAAHSAGYEIDADGLNLTFHSQSYDTAAANWNTPVYVVYQGDEAKVNGAGYAELFVMRSDNYGWAGANNTAAPDGLVAAGFTIGESTGVPADDAAWAEWRAANKAGVDCSIKATKGDGNVTVELTNNGLTSKITIPADTSKPVYLSVSGELCKITDLKEATGTPDPKKDTPDPEKETPPTKPAPGPKKDTPKTGDVAPIAALAAVAVVACAGVVVSRKKVTE